MSTTAANPHVAPALTGNTRHAYVVGGSDVTLPLTITAASNDQIEFNEQEFLIPAGTYTTIQALCDALNVATNDEDNAGALLSTMVVFTPSRSQALRVKATSIPAGVSVLAFGTGAEHDGLASIGMADTLALAAGDPID